ncbi:MAG: nucleoside hydrolase [Nitrososphaerales archaeon]
MKVVFDMDPGIDDAITLLMALNSSELHILGILTVSGNVDLNKTTYNALRILDAVGEKITVAKGASRPLFKPPIHSEYIHGSDGLGNSDLKTKRASTEYAQKFLRDILITHKKKEVSILATGPLTNIALLIYKEPSLANRLDKIVLMGGVYGMTKNVRGNVSPYAEFNMYCDPEAADIVFNSGIKIDAVGLDVTMGPECAIDKLALDSIKELKDESAMIASRLLSYAVSRHKIFHLHDVCALARFLRPGMFDTISTRVKVDKYGKFRGRCVVTLQKGNVNVCSSVNSSMFSKFFMNGLRRS